MIGAKGLKGSSWPDLDMLPFGWLTDAGDLARLQHSLLIKKLAEVWILIYIFFNL